MTENNKAVEGEVVEITSMIKVFNEQGVEKQRANHLLEIYAPYYGKAKALIKGVFDLEVTDEEDIEGMERAQDWRKQLRDVRIDLEHTRKDLKDQPLREGRAIDKAAKIIKDLLKPAEDHLKEQESFIERMQDKRREELIAKREAELKATGVEDPTKIYNLSEMDELAYTSLLETHKKAREAELEKQRKVEEERLAKEKEVLEEQKRIKEENALLRIANNRKDSLIRLGVTSPEILDIDYLKGLSDKENVDLHRRSLATFEEKKVEQAELEKQRKEKEAELKAEQEKKRKEEEVKLEAEREKRKQLEAELEKKRKEEEDRKKVEEAKKKAEEDRKREALLSPDKDKLINLAGSVQKIKLPAVESKEAGDVINEVEKKIEELSKYIIQRAKTL